MTNRLEKGDQFINVFENIRFSYTCGGLLKIECITCQTTNCREHYLIENTPSLREAFHKLISFRQSGPTIG
jgi:hypothetical protein